MDDDLLTHAIRITLHNACHTSRYLRDDVFFAIENMKRILTSESNRVRLYKSLNANLDVHAVYSGKIKVNEIEIYKQTMKYVKNNSNSRYI